MSTQRRSGSGGTRPPLPPRPSSSHAAAPTANGNAAPAPAQAARADSGASPAAAAAASGGIPQTMDISQLMNLLSGGNPAGAGGAAQTQAITAASAVRD